MYPVSFERGAPYHPPATSNSSPRNAYTAPTPEPSTRVAQPASHPRPPALERTPGVTSDGRITPSHPVVQLYLRRLTELALVKQAAAMRDPEYANAAWHARDTKPVRAGSATWWMALRGGFARVEHVGVVIGDGEVDRDTATVIFGVAAMAVMSFAGHGAHWAFWAENNVQYTKKVAYKLTREYPVAVDHFTPLDSHSHSSLLTLTL